MRSKAEVLLFPDNPRYNLGEYIYGEIGDLNGFKKGNFEDWSYAGAWEWGDVNGTLKSCDPMTYPLDDDNIVFDGTGR